jgi:hypothetical protein
MLHSLATLVQGWANLYQNHAGLETGVAFTHIGALVASGGLALASDRTILRAGAADAGQRTLRLDDLDAVHRPVLVGLVLVFASGVLLFLADLDTFLGSVLFWVKLALVAALLANGWLMLRAERAARLDPGSDRAWGTLRWNAVASIALWLTLTLAGTALVNVG